MKVKKLRGLIYSRYDSESQFAEVIGWTRQRVNKITNGIQIPTVNDINDIANGLDCTINEIAEIFLDIESPNRQPKKLA